MSETAADSPTAMRPAPEGTPTPRWGTPGPGTAGPGTAGAGTAGAGTGRTGATLAGLVAIGLWSLLALLTASSGAVPPFQLTAICFAVAAAIGAGVALARGAGLAWLRQPWPVWALGVGGLFGYHFFYFTALRNAPAVEAGLIAYLWPLLIIVFSAFLPGERLRAGHVLGGLLGLAGAVLVVTRGTGLSFDARFATGYGAAVVCALTWSGYSVASRRHADVPSLIVTGYCAVSAALALACHLAFEETAWPQGAVEWAATLGLGLGPVGAAFYVWDHAVKRGDIQLLGAASYGAPVLSTLALVAAGLATASWKLALAVALVTAGAILAANAGRDERRQER